MTNLTETEQSRMLLEKRRSAVRVWVTYGTIFVYLVLASVVTIWLMWAGRYEVAIGILGGVAGLAGSITGFWFGARRLARERVPSKAGGKT